MRRLAGIALSLAAFGASPAAGEILELEIDGSTASAVVTLAGGLGLDLEIGFEEVLGLSPESLGVSVGVLTPVDLSGRLPSGVSLPLAFPVVVRVEPPPDGPLAFEGVAHVELHTHNLSFAANTPLRLFRARDGGPFVDVTESMGMGSYRVRGSTGGFSEFVIVADTRPAASVIRSKYERLEWILDEAALEPAVAAALQGRIDASWSAYAARAYPAAVRELDAFVDLVETHSGAAIPDVWRSSGDLANPAGELRAAAATLRLSLNLATGSVLGPLN
jgi:hypothetical protein